MKNVLQISEEDEETVPVVDDEGNVKIFEENIKMRRMRKR